MKVKAEGGVGGVEARRAICAEFARLADAGYGHFRVRWLPREQRLRFEGKRSNRWESAGAQYENQQAKDIAGALADIRDKRNGSVQVHVHSTSDHEELVVRVDHQSLQSHGSDANAFFMTNLFWD